jgi:hypothetical protein
MAGYMSEEIDYGRRSFLGKAVISVAAAEALLKVEAGAQASKKDPVSIRPGTNTSFAAIKQITPVY